VASPRDGGRRRHHARAAPRRDDPLDPQS
jgi:hypothetical protein